MPATESTGRRRPVRTAALGFATLLALTFLTTSTDALRGGDALTGFPGLVQFGAPGAGSCTGSMIARNVILTAAHCFDNLGAATMSRGTATFTVFYYFPTLGRQQVFSGPATWIVSPSYRGQVDGTSLAGLANSDHALLVITPSVSGTGRIAGTDYHDYLRIYADLKAFLDTDLQAYGAGYSTYSAHTYGQLRTTWFEVENVDYNHLVVDTRDEAGLCKGDSGGPLLYFARASGIDIPTIAGVLSQMDYPPDLEEEQICTHNDPPTDDAFYSRASWEVIRFIEAETGLSCPVQTSADKQYVRCFDLPFIEDVEYEGLPHGVAAALVVSAMD